MIIDRTAYANRWTCMHPDTKIVCFLGLLVSCLSSRSLWGSLAAGTLAVGIGCVGAGVPVSRCLKLLAAPLLFLGPALLAIMLSSTGQGQGIWLSLFSRLRLVVTQESFHHAMVLGARSMGAVSCLLMLALTTPMADLLGRLRVLRLPQILIDLMALVYRLVFILLEQVENMLHAQQLRLGFRTPASAFRSIGSTMGALAVRSFQRSRQMAMAMDCRLGTGGLPMHARRFQPKTFLDTMLMAAGLIPLILGRFEWILR